ncbi:hypothetical protein ACP70R_019951 [Stipagrostis hirtigluma subsp. patula]
MTAGPAVPQGQRGNGATPACRLARHPRRPAAGAHAQDPRAHDVCVLVEMDTQGEDGGGRADADGTGEDGAAGDHPGMDGAAAAY